MRGNMSRRCAVRLTSTFLRFTACSTSALFDTAPRMEITSMCVCVCYSTITSAHYTIDSNKQLFHGRVASQRCYSDTHICTHACKRTPDDGVSHTMYRRRFIADYSRNFNTMHCVSLFVCVCFCVLLCIQLNITYADMCYY